MDSPALIVIALFVLGADLISGRLERGFITPPMLFVGFGLLIGPAAFGFVALTSNPRSCTTSPKPP